MSHQVILTKVEDLTYVPGNQPGDTARVYLRAYDGPEFLSAIDRPVELDVDNCAHGWAWTLDPAEATRFSGLGRLVAKRLARDFGYVEEAA